MATAAPFQPERITVRVCEDLGWTIYVSCAGCRATRLVRGEKAASSPGGRLPLGQVLERRLLKCEACKTKSVQQISVSWMNVGMSETLATWSLVQSGDRYFARIETAG